MRKTPVVSTTSYLITQCAVL